MTSGDKQPLYVYQIADYPQLTAAWEMVCELSTIPSDLDPEAYQQHIAQPQLVSARGEIDSLPSAERIAYEYATCERDLQSPRTKTGPLSRLQKKNGVVKLGPGMDRERRFLLTRLLADFFGSAVLESGNYLYPPGGFKEWHTNMASAQGWRMYIINKSPHGRSFFRYVDPITTSLQTHWDENGQINIFHVNSKQPFWHAVRSIDAHRWSKGYVIPDNWRDKFEG